MNTQDTVIRIFRDMGIDSKTEVTVDTKLATHLDSLDAIEFVMCIEDEYEFEVPDSVAEGWTTIQDVVNTVNSNVGVA